MRPWTAATIIAAAVTILTPCAMAFSPIWNVAGWDADQLAKTGIAVAPWKHPTIGEDPPMNWIRVTYDCTKLPRDQDVLMTVWITADAKTVTTFRAERVKGDSETLTLPFAVREANLVGSRLQILMPELFAHVANAEQFGTGFAGSGTHCP